MTKDKNGKCIEPLDCNGCGICADYLYDNVITCMIEGEHLNSADEAGCCTLCGHDEEDVMVNSELDPDYDNDFCGTIIGYKDDKALVSVLDQDDGVWDVKREAVNVI